MRCRILIVLHVIAMCLSQAVYAHDIFVLRHFEKAANSNQQDVELSEKGKRSALKLAELLSGKSVRSIYSTDYTRTKDSVAPLASELGLDVSLYDPRKLSEIADHVLASKTSTVIVGHSNTTGKLYALLGCEEIVLSAKDYGDIFVLSVNENAGTCWEMTI